MRSSLKDYKYCKQQDSHPLQNLILSQKFLKTYRLGNKYILQTRIPNTDQYNTQLKKDTSNS